MTDVSDLNESHLALALITDALFCSDLETGDTPTREQLGAAIRKTLSINHGWNGCTRTVASAFATTPRWATEREFWCRRLAEEALRSPGLSAEIIQWR